MDTEKVDVLPDAVGELLVTQSMLRQAEGGVRGEGLAALRDGLDRLSRDSRELQRNVMHIRMRPVASLFARVPRLVHDLCNSLGKRATLELTGGRTELDKTVLEKVVDPLVHLVRNALDHGIETPAERRRHEAIETPAERRRHEAIETPAERRRHEAIETALGSCVAACIRDPVALVGGMNHFTLPGSWPEPRPSRAAAASYGLHAMEGLVDAILRRGGRRERLEAKLVGGARLLQGTADPSHREERRLRESWR